MLREAMEQKALEDKENILSEMEVDANLGKIKDIVCQKKELKTFDDFVLDIEYELFDDLKSDALVGVAFYTIDRQYIFGPNTYLDKFEIPSTKGVHRIRYCVPKLPLLGGEYEVDVGLSLIHI